MVVSFLAVGRHAQSFQCQLRLGGVDDHAPLVAADALAEEGRGRGLGDEHPGDVVRDRDGRLDGWQVGRTRHVEQTAVADAEQVESGTLRVGTVLTEHSDAGVDEFRVQVVGPEMPTFHSAGTKVFTEHVRFLSQAPKELLTLRVTEVQRGAHPIAILGSEEERLGAVEGVHRAQHVSPPGILDLDDVCAPVGQKRRRRRHERVLSDLQDADALQCCGHFDAPVFED